MVRFLTVMGFIFGNDACSAVELTALAASVGVVLMVRCAAVVRGEAAGGGICRSAIQEAPRAGRIPGGSQERSVVFFPICKVTHQLSFGCVCIVFGHLGATE